MSGTPESIAQDLHRNPGLDRAEIFKLQTEMQDKNIEVEDDALRRFGIFDTPVRLRNNNSTSRIGQDIRKVHTRNRTNYTMRRKIGGTARLYPLVHTTLGAGSFTFPRPDKKYGGRCDTPGTKYITVDNHARLNRTDKISAELWLYLPATAGGDGDRVVFGKGNSSRPYELLVLAHATQPNTLRAQIRTDTPATFSIDYVYTPNTWLHVAISWKGSPDNRLKLFINKVQQGATITTTGALTTNTGKLGIWGSPDGNNLLKANTRMAQMSLLWKEIDTTHINNHYDGLLDTSGATTDEILTIGYFTDEQPTPDARVGAFLVV